METTSTSCAYASVALDLAVAKNFDYAIPPTLLGKVAAGMRVEVTVRGRLQRGTVVSLKEKPEVLKVAPIRRVLREDVLISPPLMQLASWMARYYCAPLGKVMKILLPATIRKETKHKEQLFVQRKRTREELRELCIELRTKSPSQAEVLEQMLKVQKGILLTELMERAGVSRSPIDSLVKKEHLSVAAVQIDRSPLADAEYFKTLPKELTQEQRIALTRVCASLDEGRFETHLLFGVTGSGKTEVYLQAIDHALEQGRGAIMLVPEISLTEQTIERFRSRFEGHIAILHHRLSDGERLDEWQRIRRGQARIVIGARSAVFSPVKNLGLLIVDEEHEGSYKQTDEAPCYHARDIAVMRGSYEKAAVILGSATPSLESYRNAQLGKYTLSTLLARADSARLPTVRIIDIGREKNFQLFAPELIEGIRERQQQGEQCILFLNRRGYHTTLLCSRCEEAVACAHCDVSLTFHKGPNQLACHLCGYTLSPPPKTCPNCHEGETLKFKGIGTELVERSLHKVLPEIRTLRMDADSTRHKGSHQKLLQQFRTGKADVLIGTQMIAKGLHFPLVTLVGILNCDGSLQIPDFRASEQVFQLMTQVAGRAGRGPIPGEVVIQTRMPKNSTILHASRQDYEGFAKEEFVSRELLKFPPFVHLVKVGVSSSDEERAVRIATELRAALLPKLPASCEFLPVLAGGYARVKDRYRYQFLIRGPRAGAISQVLGDLLAQSRFPKEVKVHVDVDPLSTFF